MKKTSLTSNISLNNYSFEFAPTESTAGGTFLYITNNLSYKSRNDLNLCKASQLESTFIEIINSKKVILLLDVFINILLWMLLTLIKTLIINPLFNKLSKEKKQVFLLGDFNIDLLNYNDH